MITIIIIRVCRARHRYLSDSDEISSLSFLPRVQQIFTFTYDFFICYIDDERKIEHAIYVTMSINITGLFLCQGHSDKTISGR